MAEPPILLLTHSGDYFTIDRVEEQVRALGGRPLRINTDLFPVQLKLAVRFRGGQLEAWLDTGAEAVRLDRVKSVWSRRLWPGAMPPTLDPKFVGHCRAESRNAFFGVLGLMGQAFWVNPVDRMFAAEAKLLQLKLAGEVGLTVPPTLLTNDPAGVPPFFEEHQGRVITKLLGALSQTMDATGDFMYTSQVQREDLEALDGLRFAPQLFQPMLEKASELRVIAVGRQLFCGAVDVGSSPRVQVDWRKATRADGIQWSVGRVPEDVAAKVHALMERLGLVYGALDFIVDAAGQHHFLEINPAGEWGWLEKELQLPIAAAIAQTLVDGATT